MRLKKTNFESHRVQWNRSDWHILSIAFVIIFKIIETLQRTMDTLYFGVDKHVTQQKTEPDLWTISNLRDTILVCRMDMCEQNNVMLHFPLKKSCFITCIDFCQCLADMTSVKWPVMKQALSLQLWLLSVDTYSHLLVRQGVKSRVWCQEKI